ncbi:MAG: MobF family relaxase [Acidimicrobiales bacterium]
MLSVATVGRGGWSYYLQTVAAGRAGPGGLVEPDGTWLGSGALALGLEGLPVDERRLAALFGGADPVSGEALDSRHGRVRVLAYDCTFAAPKSVSVVHALAGPDVVEEIRRAHEASVAATLDYVERHAGRVRHRSGGTDRLEATRGLAAASFLHRTSRAPDPHLHSHVLVANLASDGDGRWSALDGRPIFLHASVAGALYRSQLRAELVRRLDVAWRWRADGFADLAGVSPEVVTAFSRRREEILDELHRSGRSGPRATRAAAASTRPEKDLGTPYETLVATWRERAYEVGISSGRVRSVAPLRSAPLDARALDPRRRRGAADVASGPFTQRDLLRVRADASPDGASVADLVASVEAETRDALASGAFLPDPDPAARVPGLRARGGRIPAGFTEDRLVTREFLTLERGLASELAAAPELDGDGRARGVFVLADRADPLDAPETLAAVVARALDDGRDVFAAAPGVRRAAHLEALTGVEVASRALPTGKVQGALVVLADAARWDLGSLDAALVAGRSGKATIVVVPAPDGAGRRALAEATCRSVPRAALGPDGGAPALGTTSVLDAHDRDAHDRDAHDRDAHGADRQGEGVTRSGRRGSVVTLVARPRELVGALVRESDRQRREVGRSLVVVADRRLAAAVGAAGGGDVETVSPSRLLAALGDGADGDRGVGIVVLGSSRLLGKVPSTRPGLARVHVSVAPPARGGSTRDAWRSHLESVRSADRSVRTTDRTAGRTERARDVPAATRTVVDRERRRGQGGPGIGIGISR